LSGQSRSVRPVGFGVNTPRYEIHLQRTGPTLAGYLATIGAVREGGIRPAKIKLAQFALLNSSNLNLFSTLRMLDLTTSTYRVNQNAVR
jgi:hypothetical protein